MGEKVAPFHIQAQESREGRPRVQALFGNSLFSYCRTIYKQTEIAYGQDGLLVDLDWQSDQSRGDRWTIKRIPQLPTFPIQPFPGKPGSGLPPLAAYSTGCHCGSGAINSWVRNHRSGKISIINLGVFHFYFPSLGSLNFLTGSIKQYLVCFKILYRQNS